MSRVENMLRRMNFAVEVHMQCLASIEYSDMLGNHFQILAVQLICYVLVLNIANKKKIHFCIVKLIK